MQRRISRISDGLNTFETIDNTSAAKPQPSFSKRGGGECLQKCWSMGVGWCRDTVPVSSRMNKKVAKSLVKLYRCKFRRTRKNHILVDTLRLIHPTH